jgi:hypothetical protein
VRTSISVLSILHLTTKLSPLRGHTARQSGGLQPRVAGAWGAPVSQDLQFHLLLGCG